MRGRSGVDMRPEDSRTGKGLPGGMWATLLALLLVPLAGGAAAEGPLSRGKNIADQRCAACHATGREDESRHPKAPAFRDLHKRYPVEHLAEALAEGLIVAHPDMPEVSLEPDDLDAFIDYLKSLER